ncbi:WD40-repeat-containing domain protein [Suillus tomentosus]|nr:WD40-repeat-containing domain protein [Suillus tomentosus]
MVLHGHVKDVVHFRVPSGQRIITGSDDGTIRVWDLENGAEIGDRWPVDDDRISVTSLALSPNGITLASGYKNGLVRLWDMRTGKVIVEWTGHTDKVRSICWSPDGERVASGSNDGTVRVWYGQSGKPVLGLNPMMNSEYKDVYTVAYSPDGTRIAVGGEEKNALNIWDAKTGELLSTVDGPDIFAGVQMVSGSRDGAARIWNVESGETVLGPIKTGHKWVYVVAYLPDSRKSATGGLLENGIKTWDATTAELLHAVTHNQSGSLLWTSDSDKLISGGSNDGSVLLWDLDTNLPVDPPIQHECEVDCVSISADGKLLVTCCGDNVLTQALTGRT